MRAQIAGSVEYLASRGLGTDEGLVTALYQDLLGRIPTASEQTRWVDALHAGGDPVDVAQQIAGSDEGILRTAGNLYQQLLRRPAGDSEQLDQAQLIRSAGEDAVRVSLLASDEYFIRYTDNTPHGLDAADEAETNRLIRE